MKNRVLLLGLSLLCGKAAMAQQDWPDLKRYQEANAKLTGKPVGIVYMGDSITDFWIRSDSAFFNDHQYVDRGISGQTSPQMLLRFRQDVIALKPKAVAILCGTNDIAGNTGSSSLEMIEDNISSMTELAIASHVRPILCSVLPANKFYWAPQMQPADSIIMLNSWISSYAKKKHIPYVDYYAVMVDDQKGLKAVYSKDGVHPNGVGYAVMEQVIQPVIKKIL
ncbi:SGNH/GDSL hydrolase family protein [Mucilaginibacter ximonensis]|uniref:SGNH/GDSL hydrolase family protein n=1 Tax=Mucilaginibacter ximonensis TaxID=538021 RepID=A0ABW5YAV9_9SPHI